MQVLDEVTAARLRSNVGTTEGDLHLLHWKKTSKPTYFNIIMFIQHAPLEMAGRKHECMQQNEHSVVSNSSQEALDRSQILWRCLQLLPSKKLHKASNSEAQWLRRQNSVGSARASRSSVLLPGPLGSITPHAFGRAQLCPCKQVNKRLSSV